MVGTPQYVECARDNPAPVYFGNRTPASLVVGSVGSLAPTDTNTYDPDALSVFGNTPDVAAGPSRVYIAPIVDTDGNYSLRVFVVCFDGNSISIYNPETRTVEATIAVGAGPFAIAFDPFDMKDVALRNPVPSPTFEPAFGGQAGIPKGITLKKYRFAYVASFTNSYMQVIDLDNSQPSKQTFETVVYTLGTPSVPKGNQ
jgi:YVTN family beta-propeller protein